ncbi:MAG: carbohydrate ABC transporter permease [Christensenellales bacterium]
MMRRSRASIFCDVLIYLFLGLFAICCVYPFYYMFIYSISDTTQVMKGVSLWPAGFTLYNYQEVFKLKGIANAFGMSTARVVVGTALTVFACSFLGYLFAKPEMPAHKALYRMLIITMYVGGGLVPTYLVYKTYGLMNSFWVYVLPGAVSAYNVVLIKTYIEQLPASLEESAMIDGAGYFKVFCRIIFPLSIPIVATIMIFSAVGQWNAWFDNHIYCQQNEALTTLQYKLWRLLNETKSVTELLKSGQASSADMQMMNSQSLTTKGVRITITMISAIPIFLVYPFMQRYFIKGIMIGAVKG